MSRKKGVPLGATYRLVGLDGDGERHDDDDDDEQSTYRIYRAVERGGTRDGWSNRVVVVDGLTVGVLIIVVGVDVHIVVAVVVYAERVGGGGSGGHEGRKERGCLSQNSHAERCLFAEPTGPTSSIF